MKLRSSTIGTFFHCPRKYDIKYNQGTESKYPSPVLEFGTGFHAGIEALAAGLGLTVARQSFNREAKSLREWDRYMGEVLLIGYSQVYKDDGLTYEAIEKPWSFTIKACTSLQRVLTPTLGRLEVYDLHSLLADAIAAGKFDGLVRDAAGDLWIMEHKTTRRDIEPGAQYWQQLELNIQMDLYLLACRELGIEVKGVIYDVIRVPKLRRLKATPKDKQQFYKRDGKHGQKGDPRPGTRLHDETKPEFKARVEQYMADNWQSLFVRERYLAAERNLDAALADLKDVAKLISVGAYPRNPQSCFAYNSECEFLPVCSGETNLRNTELYQINPNPTEY